MSRNDLNIEGYEHPKYINTNNNITYKSYNTDKSGELYKKTTNNNKYNTYTPEKNCECYKYDDKGKIVHNPNCKVSINNISYNLFIKKSEEETKKEDTIDYLNYCPTCKEPVEYECECVYQDLVCKNNHTWYIDDGKIIFNNPHI